VHKSVDRVLNVGSKFRLLLRRSSKTDIVNVCRVCADKQTRTRRVGVIGQEVIFEVRAGYFSCFV
jgi:hypothetical protein